MTVVPPVLDAVIHLSATVHITLRRTGLRLLGELREWIENHSEYLGTLRQCHQLFVYLQYYFFVAKC